MKNKIKAVSYARVSTLLGQDVENQLHGIRALIKQRQFNLVKEYTDTGVSGTKESRPGLDDLIRDARRGLFDVVVIHSIDRLGRSTKHLLNLLDELRSVNVSIISIRESLDFSTPTGQMALTMLSAVAQLEAQLTSERIRTALAVKKATALKNGSDWKCGRPIVDIDTEFRVMLLKLEGRSVRGISKILGNISKSSVSRIINQMSQKPKK